MKTQKATTRRALALQLDSEFDRESRATTARPQTPRRGASRPATRSSTSWQERSSIVPAPRDVMVGPHEQKPSLVQLEPAFGGEASDLQRHSHSRRGIDKPAAIDVADCEQREIGAEMIIERAVVGEKDVRQARAGPGGRRRDERIERRRQCLLMANDR